MYLIQNLSGANYVAFAIGHRYVTGPSPWRIKLQGYTFGRHWLLYYSRPTGFFADGFSRAR